MYVAPHKTLDLQETSFNGAVISVLVSSLTLPVREGPCHVNRTRLAKRPEAYPSPVCSSLRFPQRRAVVARLEGRLERWPLDRLGCRNVTSRDLLRALPAMESHCSAILRSNYRNGKNK